ncbi:hypothetical protein STEG23_001581 [Scotinomys teguina]
MEYEDEEFTICGNRVLSAPNSSTLGPKPLTHGPVGDTLTKPYHYEVTVTIIPITAVIECRDLKDHLSRADTTHRRLGPPKSIINQENTYTCQSDGGIFLIEVSSSQVILYPSVVFDAVED